MIRAVVDTNIFVSALISPQGVSAQVLSLWRKDAFLLLTSESILTEVERTLTHLRFSPRYGLSATIIARLMQGLRHFTLVVNSLPEVGSICRDPDDNKFLPCATGGGADYLVTGDRDLLTLVEYGGVRILSPALFIQNVPE